MAVLLQGSKVGPAVLRVFRGQYGTRAPPEEVARRLGAMPRSLLKVLMPFQLEGVRFGLERHGKCLIADEMGVGTYV